MKFFVTVPVGLEFVAVQEIKDILSDSTIQYEDQVNISWPSNWFVTKSEKKCAKRAVRGLESEDLVKVKPIDEISEANKLKPDVMPGLIAFETDQPQSLKCELKSVKVLFAEILEAQLPDCREDVEIFLKQGMNLREDSGWISALDFWHRWKESHTREGSATDSLSFRVTFQKLRSYSSSGRPNFSFSSVEGSDWLGYGIGAAMPHWRVNLKHPDVHIVCMAYKSSIKLGIALTNLDGTNIRNREAFGATSLQVQEAFCLTKLSSPPPGSVLLDPFCGTGIIPIEAVQHLVGDRAVYGIAGDVLSEETERAERNSIHSGSKNLIEVLSADATRLPFRDKSVSRIVSDMPWGRRCGGFSRNVSLYPKFLDEAQRVLEADGEAFLLTLEKGLMRTQLRAESCRWDTVQVFHVNNGYDVAVFHLKPRKEAQV